MKIYSVGGAVRDELLGLPVKDHDYVVVGSTPEEMIQLNFKPVGKDFPVFLHPETHEEYALARTERKTAKGYKGFQIFASPDVTLEQDLMRRDLTINAIAKDEHGNLVDPFDGKKDLQAGILRHVSPAFGEDPVRVLRVARFAARFNFKVAPETLELMRQMARDGEIDALVPERVWQELATGLMEHTPSRMFETLRNCDALQVIFPELNCLFGVPQKATSHPEIDAGKHTMMVVDFSAAKNFALEVRFAALTHDLGKGVTPKNQLPDHAGHEEKSVELVNTICRRLKAPADCRDLALLAARHHGTIHQAKKLDAAALIDLFQSADAYRKPQRFRQLLEVCISDFCGRTGYENTPYPQFDYLQQALQASAALDAGAIAEKEKNPQDIGVKIKQARVALVENWLRGHPIN
jgi:tRNA nucleotidyltransferase (CCA-adding enzyme)